MPVRAPAIALVFSLLISAVALVTPQVASAGAQKVVIIVGPVGSLTANYKERANEIARVASDAGANVVKVYSPNATWGKVRSAVNGANVIVYLGHGNGFPNPYSATENTDRVNGWGLNRRAGEGNGDDWSKDMVYCGEKALLGTLDKSVDGAAQWQYCGGANGTQGISPAPNFVMVYSNACYAPGAGETRPAPSQNVALQRVANYSTPILKLGGSYFATDLGSARLVDLILAHPGTALGRIFEMGNGYSESALRRFTHPGVARNEVWIQKTKTGLGTDYWYAFAGKPKRTPSGGTASYNPPGELDPQPDPTGPVTRFGGADRFATAAILSRASFSPGVPVAYVATGLNYPDALAGGVAAARRKAPILLTMVDYVPAATLTELKRLAPGRIVVLGGTGVVSDGVVGTLRTLAPRVTRLAGPDRYATAAAISSATFGAGASVAYVATGEDFPDALAGVPPAALADGPLLLVLRRSVPAATLGELQRLGPDRIVVLGSAASVGAEVVSTLQGVAPTVERIGAKDRYAGVAAISRASFDTSQTVFIASGAVFPDALAGGAVAGRDGVPLLMVPGNSVPSSVLTEVQRLGASRLVVLGGTGAISSAAVSEIVAVLGD